MTSVTLADDILLLMTLKRKVGSMFGKYKNPLLKMVFNCKYRKDQNHGFIKTDLYQNVLHVKVYPCKPPNVLIIWGLFYSIMVYFKT